MGHFVITFRIKSDDDYNKRYASFTERVSKIASRKWEETSSFYAIETTGTAASICTDLYVSSDFNANKDLMVVIDLDRKEKAVKGTPEYPHTLEACLGF